MAKSKSSTTVKVTGEPSAAPTITGFSINYNFLGARPSVSWSYPKNATDKKNARRYQGLKYQFYVDGNLGYNVVKNTKVRPIAKGKKKDRKRATQKVTGSATKYYYEVHTVDVKNTSASVGGFIDFRQFYPFTGNMIDNFVIMLQGYNSKTKDKKTWDGSVPSSASISYAANPVAVAIDMNAEYTKTTKSNRITLTAKDDGNGAIWTRTDYDYKVIKYNVAGVMKTLVNEVNYQHTDLELSKSYALNGAGDNMIYPGEAIMMHLSGVARGPHGDAPRNTPAPFIFAYPHPTTITNVHTEGTSVIINFDMGKTVNDRRIDLNTARPIEGATRPLYRTDSIVLEKFQDYMPSQDKIFQSDEAWLAAVTRASGWEEVTESFANTVRTFTRPVAADQPSAENPYARTYYRIKTTNIIFESENLVEYSVPFVHPIYAKIPSAKDEKVEFLELTPESDGTSVRIVVAYTIGAKTDPPSDDDEVSRSDGTEISWSENENAWKSNQGPSTFDMPDKTLWGTNDFRDEVPNWVTDDVDKIAQFEGYFKADPTKISPSAYNWYEKDGDKYSVTSDSQVVPGKKYYAYSGNDKYAEVTSVSTANPKAYHWYERVGGGFSATSDASAVSGKTYYVFAKEKGYEYTSTCYIQGLSEGTSYYFKARRYLEEVGDLPRTYGDYTIFTGGVATADAGEEPKLVKPATKPKSVTAKVPAALALGKALQVSWTFEPEGTQTYWSIKVYAPDQVVEDVDPNDPSRKVYKLVDDAVGTELATGRDAFGYTLIPYETIFEEGTDEIKQKGIVDFLVDNRAYVTVSVAVTGDSTDSAPVQVNYMVPPKAYMGFSENRTGDGHVLLTEQPLSVTLGSNMQNADATLRVTAVDMSVMDGPEGTVSQPADTVVYTRKLSADALAWKAYESEDFEEDVYYSNVKLPSGLPLYDGRNYEVSLVIHDPSNDLDSKLEDTESNPQPMTQRVHVAYDTKAVPPSRSRTSVHTCDVNVPDYSAQIWLNKDESYPKGSVCDIYRVTPDGATLACRGVSFGQAVTDIYAPFSNFALTRYRIALRTPDGNVEWDDFGYSIDPTWTDRPRYPIRFDWDEVSDDKSAHHSLEIPYNLNYSDSFKKLFEGRRHFGDKNPTGYWNYGVDRTSSITTDIVKYDKPEEKETVRQLASHAGPVMVRRPDGCAYVADVQVNSITNDYSSLTMSVSFTITEIEMTSHYLIAEDDGLMFDSDKEYLRDLDTVDEAFQDEPKYKLVRQLPAADIPSIGEEA